MKPTFFETPADFRAWLEEHHADATELQMGLYKKAAGNPSITWAEAVDEALCVGWIDGRGNRIDDKSWTIRFTPRRPRSIWSNRNVERVAELTKQGRMHPAGLAAFERRSPERTGVYSAENRKNAKLGRARDRRFKENEKAWSWWQAQPPSYRRAASWWVISAKKDETRERRLNQLIECSEAGEPIPPLKSR